MKRNLTLFFILVPFLCFAQNRLRGKITENNSPSADIEIVLYDAANKALKSTFSDENGFFELTAQNGKYKLEGRLLGKTLFVKAVDVVKDMDLGEIKIETAQQLTQVEVIARKKLIERKVDRLVFNVENSIAASGGDALDALKVTPGVRVQNDNITMIGKSGMAVIMDDRIIQMSGDELM